mmetsp:Transcript_87868/g.196698  ORF Transcript_87868/g.196698 Transcript_87868/m.196698 type:complete len:634 (-) Transcript_87868:9-1910(-)
MASEEEDPMAKAAMLVAQRMQMQGMSGFGAAVVLPSIAASIFDGTVCVATADAVIYASTKAWERIGCLSRGSVVVATGPAVTVDFYAMVPIEPQGVVDAAILRLGDMRVVRPCIIGTWSNWQKKEDMVWDDAGKCYQFRVQIGSGGREKFQLLCDGDWHRCLHPAKDRPAVGSVEAKPRGPDQSGKGKNWIIGEGISEPDAVGTHYDVRLFLEEDGKAQKVDWVLVQAEPEEPPSDFSGVWSVTEPEPGTRLIIQRGKELTMTDPKHPRRRAKGIVTGELLEMATSILAPGATGFLGGDQICWVDGTTWNLVKRPQKSQDVCDSDSEDEIQVVQAAKVTTGREASAAPGGGFAMVVGSSDAAESAVPGEEKESKEIKYGRLGVDVRPSRQRGGQLSIFKREAFAMNAVESSQAHRGFGDRRPNAAEAALAARRAREAAEPVVVEDDFVKSGLREVLAEIGEEEAKPKMEIKPPPGYGTAMPPPPPPPPPRPRREPPSPAASKPLAVPMQMQCAALALSQPPVSGQSLVATAITAPQTPPAKAVTSELRAPASPWALDTAVPSSSVPLACRSLAGFTPISNANPQSPSAVEQHQETTAVGQAEAQVEQLTALAALLFKPRRAEPTMSQAVWGGA